MDTGCRGPCAKVCVCARKSGALPPPVKNCANQKHNNTLFTLHSMHDMEIDTGSYNFCRISAIYCPPCPSLPDQAPPMLAGAGDAHGVLYDTNEQMYV